MAEIGSRSKMLSQSESLDRTIRILRHIDSSIRSGQMIYAYRDINNLLSWLCRGSINIGDQDVTEKILKNLRRTASVIRPIVEASGLVSGAMNSVMALKASVDATNKEEDHEPKPDIGSEGTAK